MSDEAATEGIAPAAPAAKGGGGSKLLTMLVVLNLGASGAGVFFQLRHRPQVMVAAAAAPGHDEKKAGPVVALDPFVVNLNEAPSSRYLKTTFEVELAGDKAADDLGSHKRSIRDEVLRYLSGLSVADTMGEVNKDKIQTEIVARVDKELGKGSAKRVYFTEFVVQ